MRLHKTLNIGVSDAYYDTFCNLKDKEKREILNKMPVLSTLGSKGKEEVIKGILNDTRRTSKKAKKDNTASSRERNAKDITDGQRDSEPKDTGVQEGKKS